VKASYPTSFGGITAWARETGIPATQARVRFAQYTVLRAITDSRSLGPILVFKGGNALDFVWHPNRSTQDLDFSADLADPEHDLDEARLRERFTSSLAALEPVLSVVCRVVRVERQPPGPHRTFVTYVISVGYALPDQPQVRARLQAGEVPRQTIRVEISVNEPICADERVDIAGRQPLRVSTVEDIVAEKLRALLQQRLRNRTRRQDLLDIAALLADGIPLDRGHVADYLRRKAAARGVPVSLAAFDDPEISRRAHQDYDELVTTARIRFIPFEEAWALLIAFVQTLHLDDDHRS